MNQIIRRPLGRKSATGPEILAPAGNRDSFLAALAARADAVYCGLKQFSARMAAKNFNPAELAALAELARAQGTKLYLAVNTLVRSDEMVEAGRQLDLVSRHIRPDALIIQDLAMVELAKQVGFAGELHLSTLANVSFSAAFAALVKTLGIHRVVVPRELSIDEIKRMAADCPRELALEVFVHGALCYGVSGRCYWSSYLGGKSGLRGRCVQPCRRRYRQKDKDSRFFSCQDLSADVLVKVLAGVDKVAAWKIEGRKKGAHYVYYTVQAYRMLRDEGHDPQAKKAALGLLEQALGRPGTHYHILPQRPQNPIDVGKPTGSGLLTGAVLGGRQPYIKPRLPLLAGDTVRIGTEDDPWHQVIQLPRGVPKGGQFRIKPGKGRPPAKGTPVFLTDRREPALAALIEPLQDKLTDMAVPVIRTSGFELRLPPAAPRKPRINSMVVMRRAGRRNRGSALGIWLDETAMRQTPAGRLRSIWWWLPPVIWPDEQDQWAQLIDQLCRQGGRRFVLNAPWQVAWFRRRKEMNLWAGPFCNTANPLAVRALKLLGFNGVVASPELGQKDLIDLAAKSALPMGVVISGHWPFCVSRVVADQLDVRAAFTSPRGEKGWVRQHGSLYWVFPNWPIDLSRHQEQLARAGYRCFVHLDEPVPRSVQIKMRPGQWNYKLGLK